MKKILLILILIAPILATAQKKKKDKDLDAVYGAPVKKGKPNQAEPFKGATTITANYSMSGDSLFRYIQQKAVAFGYTIDKKDNDFFVFTTELKPIKDISYKMRAHITSDQIRVTSEWISSVSFQIGYVKTEPKSEILKYTSKVYATRNAFDEIISFIEGTNPTGLSYSK